MKRLLQHWLAGALFLGATSPVLLAEGSATNAPAGPKKPTAAQEERRKARQDELSKLTPEERAAKRKEAQEKADARLKELRAKRDAGTLTDKEKAQLERLENRGKDQPPGRRRGQGHPKKHQAEGAGSDGGKRP